MKFHHCRLKILKNQNVANGQMEALTDGHEKSIPPPHPPHAQFAGGVQLRTSNCGEIDIAYHVYMLAQGQAHFN